ncbi:hypothetical protein HYFRA_00001417 [Hymenoscyphus fraxineus]|uniref:Uncharacterized protein n=1 Tax=Hymenoscyphus fraxineus TaxID=746836 RepID=A0A9N9L9P4_9HELO|nr:hypothetical protein HYFRA_00001417 [Hymenoscyphus fraxineus]
MFSQFDPEICKKDVIIAATQHIHAGRRDQFHIPGETQEETRVIAEIQDILGGPSERLDLAETSGNEHQPGLYEHPYCRGTASDMRAASLDEAKKGPEGDGRADSPQGAITTELGGGQEEASKYRSLCRWIFEKLCIKRSREKGVVRFAKDEKAEEWEKFGKRIITPVLLINQTKTSRAPDTNQVMERISKGYIFRMTPQNDASKNSPDNPGSTSSSQPGSVKPSITKKFGRRASVQKSKDVVKEDQDARISDLERRVSRLEKVNRAQAMLLEAAAKSMKLAGRFGTEAFSVDDDDTEQRSFSGRDGSKDNAQNE